MASTARRARTNRITLRQVLLWLHLYVGLIAGLLISVMGLSGSALVFSHEIDEWLNPSLLHATPQSGKAPLQPIVSEVESTFAPREIDFIRVPQTAHGVYEFWLDKGHTRVYADPYSGQILGAREARRSVFGWLFDLHTELLNEERGKTVVGIGGLMLLTLGITGLVLWWPRHNWRERFVREGFTIRRGASWKRINWDVHRVLGVCVVVFLSLLAVTGLGLVFPDAATALITKLTGAAPRPPKPKSRATANAKPLPLDDIVRAAQKVLPEAAITRITPAAKADAPVIIRKRFPGEWHPNGQSNVFLDRYSGRVLLADSSANPAPARRLMDLRYPLHIGAWGGLVTRALQVLVGLTPAILYVTGLLIWWSKTSAKRRSRAAQRDRAQRDRAQQRGIKSAQNSQVA